MDKEISKVKSEELDQMSEQQHRGLLGYYNYTVILTYVGLILGFSGITSSIKQMFRAAMLFLMSAGFCDMFDGTVAATKSRTSQEKRFGIQIDSLCDLVCFGLLPAIFIFNIDTKSFFTSFIAGFYLLCALIRLAYFNVSEEDRQEVSSEQRSYYSGLPVTSIALILPTTYLVYIKMLPQAVALFPIVLGVTGTLFLTPFRMKKPHLIGKVVMVVLGIGLLALMLVGAC